LKIPKKEIRRKSKDRTDNTMATWKRTETQTMVDSSTHCTEN